MSTTTAILAVAHLTKRYGAGATEVIAVRDVSLTVAPGEIVLIMGPSGSGKSTLLMMLGALLRPTEGTIELQDLDLSALPEARLPAIRLRHFGFIFQDFNLLAALTARENVALVAELGGLARKAARQKATALLTDLGLGARLDFLPDKLSGGEKQRIAIARLLLKAPDVVVLDEATAHLDSESELAVQEALRAAQILPLVESLPDGLDTVVGDRGYRLSGGEKQRIAIARLLLKAPDVVVLDEATAHLDSESEAAVQEALRRTLAGRTSLVIAHRLSTVRDADQLLVVDGGRIVERGTHRELLAAGGLYTLLYHTQFADQEDDGTSPLRHTAALG